MYRRHGQKLSLVFLCCDLAVTAAVWVAAYYLRFAIWHAPNGVPDHREMFWEIPIVLALAGVVYRHCGLYEIHRLRQLPHELGVLLKANILLFLLVIAAIFYRRDLYESRLALALFPTINLVALTITRRAIWRGLKILRRRGLNHGRAIIVGAGRAGRLVAQTILNNEWTGLEPVGFVDRRGKVDPTILPRLGDLDHLAELVTKNDIDHVFVALPVARYGELPAVWGALSPLLVDVQLVPDLPNLAGMRVRTLEIDQIAFLSLRQNPHAGLNRYLKRAMDLALGTAALVLLSPLIILLAVLVKFSSPGPILFRQPRAGLNNRTFYMLKFRSMRTDAENRTGPVWATKTDDRCTPLGRLMRRWSLDELPQLFNVLAGDMSLVGPRPERWVFVDKFSQHLPHFTQRHQVKSGITGWAQVNGWRGNTSLRRRLECDLYYISNWSIGLDLKILVMTLWRGFRHPHAY
jgi:Undecaprenyl-phosphate glucose phosphotransferase